VMVQLQGASDGLLSLLGGSYACYSPKRLITCFTLV
jgi:hypothetical protein